MNILKSSLITPSIILMLSANLFGQESYTIQNNTLQEALEIIAKKAKLPYIVEESLIQDKKAPNIDNVEGLENTLKQLLKNTKLKAIIKNDTIIIKKQKTISNNTTSNNLGNIEVVASTTTDGNSSYTVDSMSTSTKLNLSLKDTPQSVSVMTIQKIEDLGLKTYEDLLSHITGITFRKLGERAYSTARGFEISYFKIDGVPTYKDYSYRELDLSLYERVEIVRGANGLTTSIGNPSISINLVRKKANSKKIQGEIIADIDGEGSYSISSDISSKLNNDGSVRGRFIAKHEDAQISSDIYEKEKNLLYAVVDTDLSDTTKLSTGFSYEKSEEVGVAWGGLPAFYSDGTFTSFDRDVVLTDESTYLDVETKSVFVNFEHYFLEDSILNIDYSYDKISTQQLLTTYGGSVNKETGSGIYGYAYSEDRDITQHNIDINVNIPFETNGLKHEIVAGVSYSEDKTKKLDQGISYVAGYNSPIYLTDINNYDITASDYDLFTASVEPEKIEQKAAYIANKILLSDDFKVIAGARLSSYEYSSKDDEIDTIKYSHEFTPYLGLVYDINKENSIYTSYTSIFNPQEDIDKNGDYLDPVFGNSFEIGIKGEYFDKKITTSLSLFRIEQDNAAEKVDGVTYNAEQVYTAVDGVTSKGFEFDISGQVTDLLNIDLGISHFQAKDNDGSKYDTEASRTTANIATKYNYDSFTFGAEVNYKSKIYEETTSGTIKQNAYYLVNTMIGYKLNKNFKTQINIENLFDKKYYTSIGTNSMYYGSSRNIVISLKYKF